MARSDEWAVLECFHVLPISYETSTVLHATGTGELFCIACDKSVPVSKVVEYVDADSRTIEKAQRSVIDLSFRAHEEEFGAVGSPSDPENQEESEEPPA